MSEDPVGWNAERLSQPTRGHAFGYAAGNPLLYTDPLGLDVGQPDSTTKRAQEDMAYEAARNEWAKDDGNWVTGCLAAEADNWRHIDSAAFNSRSKSPGWLAGYLKCQGRPAVDAWYNSDIGRTTREFWTATPGRAQTMGCVLGGGNGVLPVGDVSSLPEGMQSTAAACEFGVGAATAVVTLGEAGVGVWRGLKNMRPMSRPALAGVTTEGRTASVADSVPNTMAMAADDAGRGSRSASGVAPRRGAARAVVRGKENVESFESLNAARTDAQRFANLGEDAVPFVQEIGPQKGKVTGMQSRDGLKGWRLDYKPGEGVHVNWWDKTQGATRSGWAYGMNKIPAMTYDQYLELLQHFPSL